MRYGELFAGAGGLSLGLDRAGFECAFHAEIEPFPRRVLKAHWPDVPLYGDVTTLDGRKLIGECGPIDLLSGGSPCQDLSVAGKRAGMTEGSGTRSSLFYEQVRLYNETNAEFLLWENVDGARSSNNGKDFALVLSALVGGTVAVPGDGWRSAGVAVGAAGIAAWRVLDAQFFGVPQRRRRVFVLCSRTGRVDPAEVLLEREGVCRDSQESREAGEATAPGIGERIEGEGGVTDCVCSPCSDVDGCRCLGILPHKAIPLLEVGKRTGASTDDPRAGIGIGHEGDPMFTLQRGAQHGVLAFKSGQSEAAGGTFVTENYAPTLQGTNNGSTAVPAVLSFGWQNSAEQGDDVSDEYSAPLRKNTTPAVLCATGETTHGLTHEGHDAYEDGTGRGTPIVVNNDSRAAWSEEAPPLRGGQRAVPIIANTVTAREQKGWNPARDVGNGPVTHGIPRRLLPIECERLMDWEDGWTDIPDESGKPASDSARYKACGNGVVSAQSEWIGRRLLAAVFRAAVEAW